MKVNSILAGVLENCVFLFLSVVIYHLVLINYVRAGYDFLGTFTFFVIEALVIPCVNLLFRNYRAAIGNILGIGVYFLIGALLMVFAAMFLGYRG